VDFDQVAAAPPRTSDVIRISLVRRQNRGPSTIGIGRPEHHSDKVWFTHWFGIIPRWKKTECSQQKRFMLNSVTT